MQGLKAAYFFYVPKILFPSQNSADISSASQDSYCTAEKKSLLKVNTKCAAEAKELSDVNVGRYTLRETEIFTSLLYSSSLKSISILITVVLVQIQ